jgi:phosphatidylserine decarboxylase
MVTEGYKFALPPLVLGGLALGFGWKWPGAIFVLLGLFVLYFFRNPERTVPADPAAVVSPADGRVLAIVEESLEGRAGRRLSIFLSIWDVHVNRAPLAGRIEKIEHRPGRFYAAMRARASAENEQNVIILETGRGRIVCKQIAGWIARRVVCWKAEGDRVERGERIGMILFGSRVDVWLPGEAEIAVRRGAHVAAGTSVLARWK